MKRKLNLAVIFDQVVSIGGGYCQSLNALEVIDKLPRNISNVQIHRNGLNDQIQLNIETGKPGILVGDMGSGLETLLTNLKKILPASRQLTIKVFEIEKNKY